jgi:hypothetical protein
MLDEVNFMQVRLFRVVLSKLELTPRELNEVFEKFDIWNYIEQAYDVLHIQGDDVNADEIIEMLQAQGAEL